MAYYNANEVIRLTRKAMGLTQEQLCEGVCEIVTLSRIENGHTSVKRTTYKKLMEKMGRIPETRYAICVSKDGGLAEDRLELERAFKRYDYEAAEYYLQRLKENADDNLLTRQYIARVEAVMAYCQTRIGADELGKRLEVIVRKSVPEYEQYLNSKVVFPFVKLELQILTSLANAYRRVNETEKSILLYETILHCLDAKYMGEPDTSRMQVATRNSLAIVYEVQGEYEKAIVEIDKCLDIARKYDYGHTIATLLSAKAFNILKLVYAKRLSKESIDEAKKLSQQAYYIAVARGDEKVIMTINAFWHKYIE